MGHLAPGLAVAEVLTSKGADILFIGSPRGPEARAVPASGYEFIAVEVIGRGRGAVTARNVVAGAKLAVAGVKCAATLRRFGPDAVLGTGGYVSLPATLAAGLMRIPLVLHEQNSVPGLANRVARRFAKRVGVSFPGSEKYFGEKGVLVGNPVRGQIASFDRMSLRREGLANFGLDPSKSTLLVFGGSQGAQSINRAVTEATASWDASRVQILHLSGLANYEETVSVVAERVSSLNPTLLYRVVGFTDRMDLAYACADLALCRAGASTIAELATVGLPAVLVPLPFALDNDQLRNAEAVVEAGGGRLLLNADLNPETVVALVEELLAEPGLLPAMSEGMRRLARPDAAERLADLVLEVAKG